MSDRKQLTALSAFTELNVRFNDCDPLGIVWHGNYITYLEDARAAFGEKYGISYLDIYDKGFIVPIVNVNCDYKTSLKFGDKAIVEINHIYSPASKLIFEYKIKRASDKKIAVEAKSTQVFLDNDGELYLTQPKFYQKWIKKNYDKL
jgi:acyl-CoA thioester hydrolase